ncbi:hypothetical protein H257_11090 [Aphanomyces astaci]|uniref:Reverse transcriptase RNase H-like domain-containing protein n=1 Tax=Aphanomyces astaci TaxID=112090 RepID=W4G374_APHAT|nr:hypothetical protein H257_11090 [Aphanomyces astaci]ETV74125.1 hypothetical protein H257_11090 [Aphanomyces astaci]|eukprot:XP_009836231.1 hypothetical protein H257_11090 [Aphanomyces astaci]
MRSLGLLPRHECGFVYNAAVLPDPPSFKGSTKSERRTFIRHYNNACMEVFTKKRVAMWDMAIRDYRGVTEADAPHERLTTAIRFDTTILDADSSFGKMIENLIREDATPATAVAVPSGPPKSGRSEGSGVSRLSQVAASSDECNDDGMHNATPNIQVPPTQDAEGERNRRDGLTKDREKRRLLLVNHYKVFSLEIGHGKPIKWSRCGYASSMKPRNDAVPVKYGLQRYPPTHTSAPRIVLKKDSGDLRIAIDRSLCHGLCRTNLDASLTVLVGDRAFLALDWFKGYWQLALHEDAEMFNSFMTPFGLAVDFVFAVLLLKRLLAWLDDMLGCAEIPEDLQRPLRLSPHDLLLLRPKVLHEEMRLLPDQGRLFVCATNWMRASIPCYTELVGPQPLDAAIKRHQPLAFLSAAFPGTSERWPVVEKEEFAVVESCKPLSYILTRPADFRLLISTDPALVRTQQVETRQPTWCATGHRRIEATTKAVHDVFAWSTLEADDKTIKPQELIHFDCLSMSTVTNRWQKVLVVKDDMSGIV